MPIHLQHHQRIVDGRGGDEAHTRRHIRGGTKDSEWAGGEKAHTNCEIVIVDVIESQFA